MNWLFKKRYCSECSTKFEAMNYKEKFCSSKCREQFVQRKNQLKTKYKITQQEYAKIAINQNGVCAICGNSPTTNLSVDHDHQTGKIRGLLCSQCNSGLGMFKDNLEFLQNAELYLERHSNRSNLSPEQSNQVI